jgi:hypothetical protein
MKYPNYIGSGSRVFIACLQSVEVVFLPLSNQIVSRMEARDDLFQKGGSQDRRKGKGRGKNE